MAPELFLEDGVHSYASDLWSLGCVLFRSTLSLSLHPLSSLTSLYVYHPSYEMGAGRPPFVSRSFEELWQQVMFGEFHTSLLFFPSFFSCVCVCVCVKI